jgi:hypothetical protein
MEFKPLGSYRQFTEWSGHPVVWGPDGQPWRAWFAGRVVDGLVEVIDEHADLAQVQEPGPRPFAGMVPGRTAALGCVPWLTNYRVASALARMSACCIVVNKGGASHTVSSRLRKCGGFPNVLANLRDKVPDADAVVLGPTGRLPEYDLGPLRIAGWQREGEGTPLLHAKLLVLGHLVWGEDDFGREELSFSGRSVWMGSANWTQTSGKHLETGFWSMDPHLVDEATDFLGSVIAFSEPWDATCVGPEPDLIDVEFDDDAMREAAAQLAEDEDEDDRW